MLRFRIGLKLPEPLALANPVKSRHVDLENFAKN